jgi:hypothetical protein
MKPISAYYTKKLIEGNVHLINQETLSLRCGNCGQEWQPVIQRTGKLGSRWWRCPQGCYEQKK